MQAGAAGTHLTAAGSAHNSYPWELWEMAKEDRSGIPDMDKMGFLKVCHKSQARTVTFTGEKRDER